MLFLVGLPLFILISLLHEVCCLGQQESCGMGSCPCITCVLRTVSKLAFKNHFSIAGKCIIYLSKRKWTQERAAADEA